MDDQLADRVRQFLCDFWFLRPGKLRSDTRLEEDLGMTGGDAAEFLEAFGTEFGVDLTGIEFPKHFGPECGPTIFVPRWLEEEMKALGKYPVTVGHLIEVAAMKRWSCPPLHGEKPWPQLPPTGVWDRELDGDTDSKMARRDHERRGQPGPKRGELTVDLSSRRRTGLLQVIQSLCGSVMDFKGGVSDLRTHGEPICPRCGGASRPAQCVSGARVCPVCGHTR